ncbi:protein of unknown function [Streptomyces sp. KY70]|nr:protein of unknown function [Streptomyces sp. KY70]
MPRPTRRRRRSGPGLRPADAARESLRLIEGGQSSSRTRKQLVAVRERLGPHRASPAVRDTFDLLTDHVA